MLLTRADMEDRERFLNARDTLRALLDNNIVPVINENDAVATAEIKVGDNDNLSRWLLFWRAQTTCCLPINKVFSPLTRVTTRTLN